MPLDFVANFCKTNLEINEINAKTGQYKADKSLRMGFNPIYPDIPILPPPPQLVPILSGTKCFCNQNIIILKYHFIYFNRSQLNEYLSRDEFM
jgi:hypothetical protein